MQQCTLCTRIYRDIVNLCFFIQFCLKKLSLQINKQNKTSFLTCINKNIKLSPIVWPLTDETSRRVCAVFQIIFLNDL